jgi:phage-related protein (TIGR01555 family)
MVQSGDDGPKIDPYVTPKPPPGVIPSSVKMAMDADLSSIYAWAQNDIYNEGMAFLGYPALAQMSQRAEYRRPAEIIAKEMTRKWITFQTVGEDDKSDKITQIEAEFTRLGVQKLFREATEQDGFFGRAQIFIDIGSTDDNELVIPLSENKAKISKQSLRRLVMVEPVWTYPNKYNSSDPLEPDFYKPQTWFVIGKEIHASRLLTFVSRDVPDMLKPAYSFGGLSLSQMCKPYVDNWLRTRQSVSDMLHSYSVSGLKTNMSGILNGGGGQEMYNRAQLFNNARDNKGLMLIDKDTEEFFNVSTPLSELGELQKQAQEQMCSVTGIPMVKLLGLAHGGGGLDASKDEELQVFDEWIGSQQEALFTPHLTKLLNIVQLSLFGEIDSDITFRYEPRMIMDETQIAMVRKTEMETDGIAIDKGILDPHESRVRLAAQEDSPYHGLDLNHDPELPEQESSSQSSAQGGSSSLEKDDSTEQGKT